MITQDDAVEDDFTEEPVETDTTRRRIIGCCALLIIGIFIIALIVGYASWFHP